MGRPRETAWAQEYTRPLDFIGSGICTHLCLIGKPGKWQTLASAGGDTHWKCFTAKWREPCKTFNTEETAGMAQRKRTKILAIGLPQPWQGWQLYFLKSVMGSDDFRKFYLKKNNNKAVKVSPQKNAWGNTSSPRYRNASETPADCPKKTEPIFWEDWTEKVSAHSFI